MNLSFTCIPHTSAAFTQLSLCAPDPKTRQELCYDVSKKNLTIISLYGWERLIVKYLTLLLTAGVYKSVNNSLLALKTYLLKAIHATAAIKTNAALALYLMITEVGTHAKRWMQIGNIYTFADFNTQNKLSSLVHFSHHTT